MVAQRTWQLLSESHPLTGLERACDRLLARPEWSFLDKRSAAYSFERLRPVGEPARSYYMDSVPCSDTPRVVTTFDMLLQRRVGAALDELMEEHRPAIAMAVVVDVASGNVLALDSRDAYGISGYAPLHHQFTPGSTFKPLIAAAALDAGVVRPETTFDVGYGGEWRLSPGRVIHEAESSEEGVLTVAECVAHSVNAGMVQIGLRVDAEVLHGTLKALHYGDRPVTGLGGERPGYVKGLPWRRNWTHASVCFGHEMLVSLWQHAAGLAALIRGGEWRPLRLIDAIEQDGLRYELPYAEPERVFSTQTANEVRRMMALGARIGTGEPVAGPDVLPELVVGTKTGTAEKVPTEPCLHHELVDQLRHQRERSRCTRACRRRLVAQPRVHRTCYTSSMCIFGRRLDSDREVMVLVVVDEPRGREKFGSRVAGPTAVAILQEAVGATALGEKPVAKVVDGFLPSEHSAPESADRPWAEAAR